MNDNDRQAERRMRTTIIRTSIIGTSIVRITIVKVARRT
jgi:hypothetical protein